MSPNATELSAITRMFSSAVFQEMAKKGRSPLLRRLLDQTRIAEHHNKNSTVGNIFEFAFSVIKLAGRRDEYVYRAALTKNILMGKHSLRSASMLNEFRAGSCKADLVILNGTGTVYEIKSERDSLARLANQISNYKRVFATVNVIVSECHIENVQRIIPHDVGIMHLSRRHHISIVREAIDCPSQICPVTVLDSLRSSEAFDILKSMGIDVPIVPNTQRRQAMRHLFANLDPSALHREMVTTLKRTRNLSPLTELVDQLPTSLHAAALSIPIRRSDHTRLVEAVTTPLDVALSWI